MLANILPGLRELRTPLVLGWTWLIVAWLLLAPVAPAADTAQGLVADVIRGFEQLGRASVGFVVFVAYLLGSLVQSDGLKQKARRPHTEVVPRDWSVRYEDDGGGTRVELHAPPATTNAMDQVYIAFVGLFGARAVRTMGQYVASFAERLQSELPQSASAAALGLRAAATSLPDQEEFRTGLTPKYSAPSRFRWGKHGASEVPPADLPQVSAVSAARKYADILLRSERELRDDLSHKHMCLLIAVAVLRQKTELETRLLAEKRDVYDYYDRLVESYVLRLNLAMPIALIGLLSGMRLLVDRRDIDSLVIAVGPPVLLFAVATLVALALTRRATQQRLQAGQSLSTAITSGIIKSPILEQWTTDCEAVRRAFEASIGARNTSTFGPH